MAPGALVLSAMIDPPEEAVWGFPPVASGTDRYQ